MIATGTMMMQNEEPVADRSTDYKGRALTLYHPNGKGTGSAMRLEPRINRDDRDRYNCFFLEMAAQKTAAEGRGGNGAHASFDWAGKITVKLGFLDIAEFLTVLEGRTEKVGGPREGLYHASAHGNTLIGLQANREQKSYRLSLSAKRNNEAAPRRIGITLSDAEAMGLRCLLQSGLFWITFPSLLQFQAPADRAPERSRDEGEATLSPAGRRG